MKRPDRLRTRVVLGLAVAMLAGGALAFGGVYPWIYWPLAGGCALTAAVAATSGRARRRMPGPVVAGLSIVMLSGAVQLVPLPVETLWRISPSARDVLPQYDLRFAALSFHAAAASAPALTHPLSIEPRRTLTALALAAAFGAFLAGLSAMLDEWLVVRLVRAIVAVSLLIAIIAIVQKASGGGKIYGLWTPQNGDAAPFGPFVNPNHFAGWMLMAVPLGLGYVFALLTRMPDGRWRSWRSRVTWLTSRSGGRLVMTAFALSIMAMSVVMSLSRSGLACLAFGVAGLAGFAVRQRATSATVRAIVLVALGAVAILCAEWTGTERIAGRFDELRQVGLGDRLEVWSDGWAIARRFPLAGTGLDTFGVAMLFFQRSDLKEHFAEAHSDYVQIAAEGGLLISLAALVAVALIVRDVRRRFAERRDGGTLYWIRCGAVTGLLAIALQETCEFSLQMPANVVLFCVLLAVAAHRPVDHWLAPIGASR